MLRTHKLACFDMDSTLIEQEVIVELAKAAGVGEKVEAITEAAMRGEIDFNELFAQRVALLKGLSTDVLDEICGRLTLSTGARTTINALKALGYHTVLVSGGFTYFARYIAEQLGIDEVHANTLDIEDGKSLDMCSCLSSMVPKKPLLSNIRLSDWGLRCHKWSALATVPMIYQ